MSNNIIIINKKCDRNITLETVVRAHAGHIRILMIIIVALIMIVAETC